MSNLAGQKAYRYEVAFSFLKQDEALAFALNDLLQDHMGTFIYSKQQEVVAGTDGEKTFNRVFGEEARLVVVLYRDGWGASPWTRIEETAIRNRGFEEGYDFVKFILVEAQATVPKWLPKAQIWIGLARYGNAGAAAAIDARVQELGGAPREETVADRAARLERELNFSSERAIFLESEAGAAAAEREFKVLQNELEKSIVSVQRAAESINLQMNRSQNDLCIFGSGPGLGVEWRPRYRNSLDGAALHATLFRPYVPPGHMSFDEQRVLHRDKFTFDLLPPKSPAWIQCGGPHFTTTELASHFVKQYLEEVRAGRLKDR